jgi:hypothetical protein
MPEAEQSIDEIRAAVERAGLTLADEELAKLQKSTARYSVWRETIRSYLSPEIEPAPTFTPAPGFRPLAAGAEPGS